MRHTLTGIAFLVLASAALAGEEIEDRVQQLEEQNRKILERLEESESRNASLKEEVTQLRQQGSELLEREIEAYLDDTQQLAGGGAAGLETKKGAFVTLYGFIRLDLYYNSARANSIITPTVVRAEDGVAAGRNDDAFAFDVHLTRIGFAFNFGRVGNSDLTGKIETDFANFPGVPESRETPRIRLAYIQLEGERGRFRFGQDWDQVSPLYPSVNHETLMWNAGNPGDRRPMMSYLWKASAHFTALAALGLTGAINNQDLDATLGTFTSTERDGFDSGLPQVQFRAAYTAELWVEGKSLVIGLWGFFGTLETDTLFNGENDFETWMGGIDFTVPIVSMVVIRGEAWWGQALGDIRGNIGQTINTATGAEIEGWGGWMEVRLAPNDEWMFALGGSIDDPSNSDVPQSAAGAELNWSVYVHATRHWTKTFKSGIDIIYWETQYGDDTLGNMIRVDIYAAVDF